MQIRFYLSIALILLLGGTSSLDAQQNVQYTQFMYSKLWMNPAYAGSHDATVFQTIARSQWLGLEGAPKSQSVNFHTSLFRDNVGVGLSLNHDRVGPTDAYFVNLSYAYKIRLQNDQKLALGIQGNLTSYSVRYNQLAATDGGDSFIPVANRNLMKPNFGFGVYYSTEDYFVGFSAPLIVSGKLHVLDNPELATGRQEFHSYLMAGLVHNIDGEDIQGKPSILLKKVANVPFDIDFNYSLIFHDKIWVGASYRLGGDRGYGFGESIDVMMQYELENGLRIGAAYDFTISDLRTTNDGSIELMAQYLIRQDNSQLTNPRFF